MTPGAELQQKPQSLEQPCWWLPGGRRCGRTDGQGLRPAWGCTGLVCGWYRRGDAEKLGLGGSRCGSGSGCGGQKDGCRLRIPSVLSAGRAAGGRTEAGSAHGQHGLEAADPAGQTDGRWTEQPAWLRTDGQTDVGLVVGEYRPQFREGAERADGDSVHLDRRVDAGTAFRMPRSQTDRRT